MPGYFDRTYEKNLEASRSRALEMVPRLDRNAILLDTGCGNGKMSYRTMAAAGADEIIGVEMADAQARQAQSGNLNVIRANLDVSLPLSDQSVDLVFANYVFAHLTDHDTFLAEVYRVLRPNGYCILSTENLSAWHNILALIAGFQDFSHNASSAWYLGNPLSPHYKKHTPPGFSPHFRIFTPRSLRDLFEAYGFQVEQWIGTGFFPLPRTLAALVERLDPWHSQFLTIRARKKA